MAIIGKNVMENLTTSMYSDPWIIYREYVQNAADSIDKAKSLNLTGENANEIHIQIDDVSDVITITDYACGIKQADFKKIMLSIADSSKSQGENKGFRGIGRLGGIAYCEQLIFTTSAPGETVLSKCIWDAKKIKELLNDASVRISADKLVDENTQFSTETCDSKSHFFKVELVNVTEDDLLNVAKVKDYLEEVAPVPYTAGFIYRSKIHDFAETHGFDIDEYLIYVNTDLIYKDYRTSLYEMNSTKKVRYDDIYGVHFEIFKDSKNKPLAWMWFGISRFEKQIPVVNKMRGIRLRKHNIQIGDSTTLSSKNFYKEPRGSYYFVGEIFAINNNLIPNARRDYFNINKTCHEFEDEVKKLLYDKFYSYYHRANAYKKALQKKQEIYKTFVEFEEKKTKIGFVNDAEYKKYERAKKRLEKEGKKALKTLELRQKDRDDSVFDKIYEKLDESYPCPDFDKIHSLQNDDSTKPTSNSTSEENKTTKSNASSSDDSQSSCQLPDNVSAKTESKVKDPQSSSSNNPNAPSDKNTPQQSSPAATEPTSGKFLNKIHILTDQLSCFTKADRKLIGQIYELIYEYAEEDASEPLVQKIHNHLLRNKKRKK